MDQELTLPPNPKKDILDRIIPHRYAVKCLRAQLLWAVMHIQNQQNKHARLMDDHNKLGTHFQRFAVYIIRCMKRVEKELDLDEIEPTFKDEIKPQSIEIPVEKV